jgi:hypothetical protein
MTAAFVVLLRHISEQYGCIALRGIGHLAQAWANAWSYETSSIHF